jgi:hypothetical protein
MAAQGDVSKGSNLQCLFALTKRAFGNWNFFTSASGTGICCEAPRRRVELSSPGVGILDFKFDFLGTRCH